MEYVKTVPTKKPIKPARPPKRAPRHFLMVEYHDPKQRELFERAARRSGLTMAGWARDRLLDAARRETEE